MLKDSNMKKSLLVFLLLMGILSALLAVPRELVVVEIATGTWCGYCPGAAMGLMILQKGTCRSIEKTIMATLSPIPIRTRQQLLCNYGYPTALFEV
jgi:hypothetical protein